MHKNLKNLGEFEQTIFLQEIKGFVKLKGFKFGLV